MSGSEIGRGFRFRVPGFGFGSRYPYRVGGQGCGRAMVAELEGASSSARGVGTGHPSYGSVQSVQRRPEGPRRSACRL